MNMSSYLEQALPSWWALLRRPEGRTAVLSVSWSHHMKRSGYHPVANGLGVILPSRKFRLLPAGLSRRIAGEGLDAAYQVRLAMKLTRCDRLLVLDGDSQLKLIEGIRRIADVRIYGVFHQIPSVLEPLLATYPPLLDGAVCVARCQVPSVQPIAPPGKTWFIPHGVDAVYFTPCAPRSDHPRVLCVGHNYRDFDTLRKSADLIAQVVPTALVRLVAPPSFLPPGFDFGRVEVLTGLSDEQLLDEYRRAWVVLLPLTDSTANNSLLESLACGTPIVASDIGGVRDYAGPDCGALCPPGDAHAHASATINLLLDRSRREVASRACRTRAESFAWPVVQEQIRSILE